jgi:hypothetical protein
MAYRNIKNGRRRHIQQQRQHRVCVAAASVRVCERDRAAVPLCAADAAVAGILHIWPWVRPHPRHLPVLQTDRVRQQTAIASAGG